MEWLVPLSAFWLIAALFLGGSPAEIEGGGGFRQVLGLLASLVIYLAVWFGVRTGLGAALPVGLAVPVATVIAAALIPLWCRLAYRVVGLKVVGPTFVGARGAH
jgi:hypothetical protein